MLVDWGRDYGVLPAHIWCFVNLTSFDSGTETIEFGGIDLKSGVYAVVECGNYVEDPDIVGASQLFIPVTLEVKKIHPRDPETKKVPIDRRFYLADCEAFHGVCSVIPDLGGKANAYFQVKPRREWVDIFKEWLQKPHQKIDEDLLAKIQEENQEKRRKKKEQREAAKKKREEAARKEMEAADSSEEEEDSEQEAEESDDSDESVTE